jgi:flagellar protein FlaG
MQDDIQKSSAYDLSIPLNVTPFKAANNSDTIRTAVDITQIQLSESTSSTSAKIEDAILKINDIFQISHTSLRFLVDSSTGNLVVQVVNQETGELLRQIPQETVNRFTDYFGKMIGVIIDKEV